MLPRAQRLQNGRTIAQIYRRGSRQQGAYLVARSLPNRAQLARVAVVISVSVAKKATERNRAKRVLRALLAKMALPPADIVVSVRRMPKEDLSRAFQKELAQWFHT